MQGSQLCCAGVGQPPAGKGELCSAGASPHYLLCRLLPHSLTRIYADSCKACCCQQQNLLREHLSAVLAPGAFCPTTLHFLRVDYTPDFSVCHIG